MNEDFDAYYRAQFGGRWPLLRKALLEENAVLAFSGIGGAALTAPYYMDKASLFAALSLRLPSAAISAAAGGSGPVLDACAAPGGKSLVIACMLGGLSGADSTAGALGLLSNELSSERRRRLSNVLDKHLPPVLRGRVKVSGFDAAAAGGEKKERGRFSAILLDAPCSSERHVLRNEKALFQWTPARPRFLARRQWALLSSCFLMLGENASLLYGTCALSEEENDGVVEKLLEKYGKDIELDRPGEESYGITKGFSFLAEKTKYGLLVLPDSAEGSGPMYMARFWKKSLS